MSNSSSVSVTESGSLDDKASLGSQLALGFSCLYILIAGITARQLYLPSIYVASGTTSPNLHPRAFRTSSLMAQPPSGAERFLVWMSQAKKSRLAGTRQCTSPACMQKGAALVYTLWQLT